MSIQARIASLRLALDCPVIESGQPGYDRARTIWNVDIDRRPLVIVQPASAAQVAGAVRWAADNGVEVTVRGGGHNLAGSCVRDGAMMIDLRALSAASYDHEAGTVTIGGGAALGQLDRANAAQGVTVPAGTVSHTGVGGLTLGGGNGYLSRLHGMTVDHLVSIELVTADGRIVEASQDENPDLFWALRGAGHNYGVATSFTFRYLPRTFTANVRHAFYAADSRADVLRFFRDWSYDGAPDDVTTYARLVEVPPYWTSFAPEFRGTNVISVATIHWGEPDHEDSAVSPMFAQADPIWERRYRTPHLELQHACDDDFRQGLKHYWRAGNLVRFPDEAIDTVLSFSDEYPGRPLQASSTIAPHFTCPFQFFPRGGATGRVAPEATSVGERNSSKWVSTLGGEWEFADEREPIIEWTRRFDDAMSPYKDGAYVNFMSDAGKPEAGRWLYGDKFDRLVAIKREYDPDNMFNSGLIDLLPKTTSAEVA
jgi:FAD/FMN-containing dehydrogenase